MKRKKAGSKDASRKRVRKRNPIEPMKRPNTDNESLTPERLEALRRKIEAGDYNSRDVAETVARRIVLRGDLRSEGRDQRGFGFGGHDRFAPHVH